MKTFVLASKNEREDTYNVNKNERSVGLYGKESFLPSIVEQLEKLSSCTQMNSYTIAIMNIPYCLPLGTILNISN